MTKNNEWKKKKAEIDEAKEECSKLWRLHTSGQINYDEYCLRHLPYTEIMGTRGHYDDKGHFKK